MPVIHFEIATANAKEVQTFYSKLFGWKIDAKNPMHYGMVDTNARLPRGIPAIAGINGGIYQIEPGMPTGIVIYVGVPDTDAYLKKVVALGGRIVKPTETIPGMVTFALFADPAGTILGLVKDTMPEAAKPAKKKKAAVSARKKTGSGKKVSPAAARKKKKVSKR